MKNQPTIRAAASIENQAIAAEIRAALVNEAIQLHRNIGIGFERLAEDLKSAQQNYSDADVERAIAEGDLTDADRHLTDCFDIAQGDLSVLEQHMAQLTAALAEFRIRRRTVEMVLRRFAGASSQLERRRAIDMSGNGSDRLPAVKE